MSLIDFAVWRSLPTGPAEARRRDPRLVLDWPARLRGDGDATRCWVLDLAPGGARVRVAHRLRRTADLVLAIDGYGCFPCRLLRVARRDYAVAFLEPPEQLAAQFAGWGPAFARAWGAGAGRAA